MELHRTVMALLRLVVKGLVKGGARGLVIVGSMTSLALLSGCSSGPKPKALHESFEAKTTAEGLKVFTYRVDVTAPQAAGPVLHTTERNRDELSASQRARFSQRSRKQVMKMLENRLQQNNYCPHGWFVIRQDNRGDQVVVLGECKSVLGQEN